MTKAPQDIILKPIITEKSSMDSALGKYSFKVDEKATKTEIRMAIEKLFNVKVLSVNTSRFDGKVKRQRGFLGTTSSYKKAVVSIKTDAKEASSKVKGAKSDKTSKAKEGSYKAKGGKIVNPTKKYKTSIEEFGFGQ
jgi:large subunit ribosomal protein L23